MIASVVAHQITTFSDVRNVGLKAFATPGGPGTIVVIITSAPTSGTPSLTLAGGSAGASNTFYITDNQFNVYSRVLRSTRLGDLMNVPGSTVEIYFANENTVALAGGTQFLSPTVNFTENRTGIADVLFVEPAISFDSINEDSSSPSINVGVLPTQPGITISTQLSNEVIIGCIATMFNVLTMPDNINLGSSNPGVTIQDTSVIQFGGSSNVATGVAGIGLVVYTYLQKSASSVSLFQTLSGFSPISENWVELALAAVESSAPGVQGISQPLIDTPIAGGVSGQIVQSGTPAGPIIKLPFGT